jgi:hypothetical protein
MTAVEIKITAKVGAATFEIASKEGDVLHHITGSDFLKKLMDLASHIDAPDADVAIQPEPAPVAPVHVLPPALAGREEAPPSESSMGSVDSFLARGGRVTPLNDGTVMEEEPIFSPEETTGRPVKTFSSRVDYGSSPEEQKRKQAMERLNDADGWAKA